MPHLRHPHPQHTMQTMRNHPRQQPVPGTPTTPPPHRPQLSTHLTTTPHHVERRPIHHLLDLRRGGTTRRPVASRPPHTRRPDINPSARPPHLQRPTRSRTPMVKPMTKPTTYPQPSTPLARPEGAGHPHNGFWRPHRYPITRQRHASDSVIHRFVHRRGVVHGL